MKDFDSDRVNASARPKGHPDVGLTTEFLLVGEEPPYLLERAIARSAVKGRMRFEKIASTGALH